MLSAAEAAKELGVARRYLRRLEGHSETFLARHDVKGGTALYDEAAIQNLAEVLRTAVRSDDCARQLGIPRYCVEAFTAAGLVDTISHQDASIVTGATLIARTSIVRLRERLFTCSRSLAGVMTVKEVMRRKGHPYDWVAVFEEMLSGAIPFKFLTLESAPLTEVLLVGSGSISLPDVPRRSGRSISGIAVPCLIAAEIIGTTSQFVSAAVQAGLIAGTVETRNSALPLEAVLEFQRKFVLTEELCKMIGESSSKSIGATLRDARYEPATVINRVRVWRRSDVEKYIKQRNWCSL